MTHPSATAAVASYDVFADSYDAFTHHHDYALWTTKLEELASRHGLIGRRLLDVGCGTGKSFAPFLNRGYEVTACDPSEGMLREAERKWAGAAELHLADARTLPSLG